MDVLTQLATYLESKGVGKVGKNIFVSEMPSSTEGILLFTTGEGLMVHPGTNKIFRGTVFAATRAKGYQQSGALAGKVFEVMEFQGASFDGLRILISRPEALPMPFGKDESGFTEWLSSYDIAITLD